MGRGVPAWLGRRQQRQILLAASVAALDQFLKYLVGTYMAYGQSIPADGGFIRLLYTMNDGVAFSFLRGAGYGLLAVQSVMVALIVAALIYFNRRKARAFPLLCMAAMLGGGIGNLIDRIRFGMVTDFIAVGNFPVFNVADSALTVGCLLLVAWLIVNEARQAKGTEGKG